MLKLFPVIAAFFFGYPVFAQQNVPTAPPLLKEKFHFSNPGNQDTSWGYAQVVKAGNTIYISGTVIDKKSADGVAHVYKVLGKSLERFGATSQHVVKENIFTTDIEALKQYNEIRKAFYKGDYPAATWVQIERLTMAETWLEIELVACLPDGS